MIKPLSKALRAALARACPEADRSHAEAGSMRVVAAGDDSVELLIYGNIGASWWDDESVTAKSVVDQLKDFSGSAIHVRINSYGGSVSDGVAIHNELRRQAKAGVSIDVTIDGAACSIASLIAVAGDTVTMPSNTLMMLHAPWGGLYIEGNAKLVREVSDEFASVLETFGRAMAQSYARKTGRAADEFTAMWDSGKDYWYTADEAKAEGLCDVVLDASEADDQDDGSDSEAAAALTQLIARAPSQLRACVRAALRRPATESRATARATQAAPSAATHEEPTMSNNQNAADAPNPAPTPTAIAAAAAEVLAGMRTRNAEIKALADPHLGNAEVKAYYDQVIADADPQVTAVVAGQRILAILGKSREPLNGGAAVHAGQDQADKHRAAMTVAIQARAGIAKAEQGNPFAGYTLLEMARASLASHGVDTRGRDRMDVVALAFTHSSSDFPNLLGDAARKSLMKGYEEVGYDLEAISRPISVPDFNPRTLVGLGAFSDLDVVPENAEYKYGTFSEMSSRIQLATYGKLFSISRQAIINDDLSVFADVPRKMGMAARRTLAKALFALLNSNPTLADGVPLFHASHANLLTGAAISTASVDLMRVAMATQTDPEGNPLGLVLKTLATPVALGGLARTVRESQFAIDASAKNSTQPNSVRNTFDVVDSALLDASSATAWYGIADPSQVDGLVIAYLDGKQEPYMEQEQGFTVDGVAWKVRLDATAAVGDYRGLAKNPGP